MALRSNMFLGLCRHSGIEYLWYEGVIEFQMRWLWLAPEWGDTVGYCLGIVWPHFSPHKLCRWKCNWFNLQKSAVQYNTLLLIVTAVKNGVQLFVGLYSRCYFFCFNISSHTNVSISNRNVPFFTDFTDKMFNY